MNDSNNVTGFRDSEEKNGYVWIDGSTIPTSLYKSKNYSFADISVAALVPFSISSKVGKLVQVQLSNVSLLSLSTHRDKYPVVSLGRKGVKATTRGHRMVAGSIGFSFISENPFAPLIREYASWQGNVHLAASILPDELPPFDLLCIFQSKTVLENNAYLFIKNVHILDSSTSVSTDNIVLSQSYSFMAESVSEVNDLANFAKVSSNPPVDLNKFKTNKFPYVSIFGLSISQTVKDIIDSGGTGGDDSGGDDDGGGDDGGGDDGGGDDGGGGDGGDDDVYGIGGDGGQCLDQNTLILCPDGPREIGMLNLHSSVCSWDNTVEKIVGITRIPDQVCYTLTTPNGEIVGTKTHRICTNPDNPQEYKTIKELKQGDLVLTTKGKLEKITSIIEVGKRTVVLLELAGPSNVYYAGGIVHHNKVKDYYNTGGF